MASDNDVVKDHDDDDDDDDDTDGNDVEVVKIGIGETLTMLERKKRTFLSPWNSN